MEIVDIIGAGAAVASVASFVPQAWRIIKTRETEGLSRRMYVLTASAFALWLTFGAIKGEWALILPNALCLALSGFILAMLIMPARERERVADALDPEAG
jgi:MtN3 and saliva related transmembrane protein